MVQLHVAFNRMLHCPGTPVLINRFLPAHHGMMYAVTGMIYWSRNRACAATLQRS